MKRWKLQWLSTLSEGIMLAALLLLTSNTVTHAARSSLSSHQSSCQWKLVPGVSPGNDSNFLAGVAAASEKDAWAVGNYYSGSTTITLTEHWNGKSWQTVSAPSPDAADALYAVTPIGDTGELWSVGTASQQVNGALTESYC